MCMFDFREGAKTALTPTCLRALGHAPTTGSRVIGAARTYWADHPQLFARATSRKVLRRELAVFSYLRELSDPSCLPDRLISIERFFSRFTAISSKGDAKTLGRDCHLLSPYCGPIEAIHGWLMNASFPLVLYRPLVVLFNLLRGSWN